MPRSRAALHNRLPGLLRQRGITWGELARRTLLPAARLRRLAAAHANPRLAVAERVAAARRAGLDRAHVNQLKNGRALPTVATALALARALGVPVATVFPPGTARPPRRLSRAAGRW